MSIINSYFKESSNLIGTLGVFEEKLVQFTDLILKTKENKNKILVAGNGGSCADAEHFTGELQCTFKDSNRKPISAFAITGTSAALTAWGNDFGFNSFFSRQVEAHGNENDVLVLISTGGGSVDGPSSNLVKAAQLAIKKNMKIVSFVGKSGGELKKISDICFHIENKVTSLIQEAHMSLLHCVCENLEDKLKGR
tara:strand:- start:7587 stop:8171 length:585 start_codon:yes stop_codon:yes gene_type:complete